MPYVDTEWAVLVEGRLAGGEVFSNRWTVAETDVGADIVDALTAFHTMYVGWAGLMFQGWRVDTIEARNLVTSVTESFPFDSIEGDGGEFALPTECAIRVSLSAAGNRHGGPFISGWDTTNIDSESQLEATEAANFRNNVNALIVALAAADFELRLDSPTDTETKAITQGRVGRTFDVIRKRRNAIPEQYLNITL